MNDLQCITGGWLNGALYSMRCFVDRYQLLAGGYETGYWTLAQSAVRFEVKYAAH